METSDTTTITRLEAYACAEALRTQAKQFRLQAKSRKNSGPQMVAQRIVWRNNALYNEALARSLERETGLS